MVDEIYSKLRTNVPYKVSIKCCTFLVDLKSNMAALVSDWLTHFIFFSRTAEKGFTPNLTQKFLTRSVLSAVTFHVDLKYNMAALVSDWLTHFQLLLQNGCRALL